MTLPGIVLTLIVAARFRRSGEERLAARYAVPAQPGSCALPLPRSTRTLTKHAESELLSS